MDQKSPSVTGYDEIDSYYHKNEGNFGMRKLIWLSCLAYMLNGIAHVVVGSILEPMLQAYGLSYEDGGQLIMNQFIGFLFGVLLAPWLIRRFGRKTTLLLSLACLVFAQTIYGLSPAWSWMLTIAPLAGVGFGMTEALVGAFIIIAVKDRTAVAMSRVEMFFGIGALMMPFLGALFIRSGMWIASFWVVGALSAVTLILWAVLWPKELNESTEQATSAVKSNPAARPLAYTKGALPVLIMVALFFMVYVGLEMSFVNYLPSILIDKNGMNESNAAMSMGLFWGAIAIGRMFAGNVALRTGNARFLLITCIASTLAFVALAGVAGTFATITITLINGLIMAGMFAMGLVFINEVIPGMAERNTSLMVAFGGLGGALFPKLTGTLMDQFSAGVTQWMLAGLSLILLLAMVGAVIFANMYNSSIPNKGHARQQ